GPDDRERHLAVEPRVMRQVDALAAPLAQEAAHGVTARGESGGNHARALAAVPRWRRRCTAGSSEGGVRIKACRQPSTSAAGSVSTRDGEVVDRLGDLSPGKTGHDPRLRGCP